MDKKKSLLNVITAISFKVVLLLLALFTRRYLIRFVGNDANGINSLFLSIIGFLSIAELGIGSAITFSMYKPITQGETEKVAAIYHLFIKIYLIIGSIIFVGGLCVMPFLPILANGYPEKTLYITFFIMLVSVVLSYAFSAKISLINAYKNNYITTAFSSTTEILQKGLQIVVLIVTKSFMYYLLVRIFAVLIHWMMVELFFRKHYKDIASVKARVDSETKKDIVKNTKAMFMHKIGGILVNTCDSLIISAFLGYSLLGEYSNYTAIMTSMTGVIALFFTPLTSVIGHLCAQESIESQVKHFSFMHYFNFIIAVVFFLGYYAIIDGIISVMFGAELILSRSVSFIITLNYFVQFMRQATLLFRDATGTFYNDRFKPILEGIVNVILSILMVQFLGIVGVLVATIVTNLIICHIVEPYVLYKNAFKVNPKKYYTLNYFFILIFAGLLVLINYLLVNLSNVWLNILVNGVIAVGLAIVPIIIIFICNKTVRNSFKNFIMSFISRFKGKVNNE